MKKYLLGVALLISGCQHPTDISLPNRTYYATPNLIGMVFFNGEPVSNAQVFLLTNADDRSVVTDDTGYFSLTPPTEKHLPAIPVDQLGFLYQVVVVYDNQQYVWQISGLGYGFKNAEVEIDLATGKVNYQITEDDNTPYNGEDSLIIQES